MKMKDNVIYVKVLEGSLATLEFPEFNIKVQAHIGENGASEEMIEGNRKTPLRRIRIRNSIRYSYRRRNEI